MRRRYRPELKDDLVRAVTKHGEPLTRAAKQLGVPVSTASQWLRRASAGKALLADRLLAPLTRPAKFMELVPASTREARLVVRVGVAEVEVRPGFDAALLQEVVDALGGAES